MMSTWLRALSRAPQRSLATAITVVLLATVAACGGDSGGYTPTAASQSDRRELPPSLLTRAAINYSPYRTSRSEADLKDEVITPANVLQDLRLVQATGIGSIRLFSSRAFARTVLEVIRDNGLDLKVQLGAYPNPITGLAAEADNIAELDACIALANAFRDIVVAVSVGNETMVEWSAHKVPVADMARYIKRVRSAIRQPVTTDDNWLFWASVPKAIAEVVDYAAVHVYPFLDTFYNPTAYDWRQKAAPEATRAKAMMDATVAEAKSQFERARAGLVNLNLGAMPMLIGETGWAAVDTNGGPNLAFRAHPVNQKMYYLAMEKWARETKTTGGPVNFFYFEAFDEPWKGDDNWFGLFTVGRKARYVVQGLYPSSLWDEAYTDADAIHWLPISSKKVTADRFTVYAESFVLNEERPWWVANAWDGTATRAEVTDAAPPDGSQSSVITPRPRFWGWGMPFEVKESNLSTSTSYDMSDFTAGTINFSIKTTTPGIVEVGFVTGRYSDSSEKEVFMPIAPGEHGYMNDGAWHKVSIPVSVLLAKAGGRGLQGQTTNMKEVTTAFVIADRYAFTGKANNSNITTPIHIDAIYWQR